MLWMVQRLFYGKADGNLHMHDLNMREYVVLVPMIAMMLWMGIYSQSFLPSVSTQNTEILKMSQDRRTQVNERAIAVPEVRDAR